MTWWQKQSGDAMARTVSEPHQVSDVVDYRTYQQVSEEIHRLKLTIEARDMALDHLGAAHQQMSKDLGACHAEVTRLRQGFTDAPPPQPHRE